MHISKEQLLAFAIYEIRLLLAHHLGSCDAADPPVRAAAHLAYALHNEADAVLRGEDFDVERAVDRLRAIDRMLATSFEDRVRAATRPG
jgi:hypothetical protein